MSAHSTDISVHARTAELPTLLETMAARAVELGIAADHRAGQADDPAHEALEQADRGGGNAPWKPGGSGGDRLRQRQYGLFALRYPDDGLACHGAGP